MESTPPQRLKRRAAAVYLGQKLGQSVSPHTVKQWKIRHKKLGRDSSYAIEDLDDEVAARLAAAPTLNPKKGSTA
jgi:hypothetical protein